MEEIAWWEYVQYLSTDEGSCGVGDDTVWPWEGEEVTGEWTEVHNGELHNLYSSPDIILIIKLGRLKWVEHVANIVEMWKYVYIGF
jgi:hypothetical protein